MKKYLKRFGVIFLIVFAVLGIQGGVSASAAKVGDVLLQPEEGWKRYDDNDVNIDYIGLFSRGSNPVYYGGAHTGLDQGNKTSYIKFAFCGTKIRLLEYMCRGSDRGSTISIDGGRKEPCSYHSDKYDTNEVSVFYEKIGLDKGIHNVVIELSVDVEHWSLDAIDIDSDGYLAPYTYENKSEDIKASGLELNKEKDSLKAGEVETLFEKVNPYNASNKKVKWTTSDESVATVDENGKVTALKEGTAIITATTTDGTDLSASCEVTVSPKDIAATGISLNKTTDSLEVGATDNLVATVKPENATNKNVKWTTSDATIATVDESGKVTALKEGKVTITATAEGGILSDTGRPTATCEVTVVKEGKAILNITMSNGAVKEYELSTRELNAFLDWYDARSKGIAPAFYTFKVAGTSLDSNEVIPYDKIEFFKYTRL